MEHTNIKKAALFDLDGVVLDTEAAYTRFWGDVGRRFRPEDVDFATRLKGTTLDQIVDTYFEGSADCKKTLQEELTQLEHTMDYPFVPGANCFLESLHDAGWLTALVTSSNREKMDHVVRVRPELVRWFDRLLMAEDFHYSKPHPDGYLTAAQQLGVGRASCIVFEDSRNGLLAGRNAGMKVVGLATTLPREEVERLADMTIPDFLHFDMKILDGLLRL